jgi:hypothetical protein
MKWEMEESTNKTLDHVEEMMNVHEKVTWNYLVRREKSKKEFTQIWEAHKLMKNHQVDQNVDGGVFKWIREKVTESWVKK